MNNDSSVVKTPVKYDFWLVFATLVFGLLTAFCGWLTFRFATEGTDHRAFFAVVFGIMTAIMLVLAVCTLLDARRTK